MSALPRMFAGARSVLEAAPSPIKEALAGLPLAQTPSNGIYAKLGLGGAK